MSSATHTETDMKKIDLKRHLKRFLRQHLPISSPLILAISGGADSMALLHSISELAVEMELSSLVAHVDHQWRKESADDALLVQHRAELLGFPFFLEQLDPPEDRRNLEAKGRQGRLNFFRRLAEEHSARAVLLAHHRDDYAETVFKNICEGVHPMRVETLRAASSCGALDLWRPFLKIEKRQLVDYCRHRSIPFVEDSTNSSEHFLRGRLRSRCFPQIEACYGKGLSKNLARFGEELTALRDWAHARIERHMERCHLAAESGIAHLDLTELDLHPVEIGLLLRRLLDRAGLFFSREQIEAIARDLERGEGLREYRTRAARAVISGRVCRIEFDVN